MKNILTNLMTSAVLLFTIGSALEAQSIRVQATVPFAWQMNGHQMKAGDYVISRDAATHVIRIAEAIDGTGSYLIAVPDSDKNPAARLVFHRYGNQYFLAAVVAPGLTVGKLPVSVAEKEAMQSEQPREVATIFVDVKPVLN